MVNGIPRKRADCLDAACGSPKMSYWHLSGAALTIWVSRNWTTDQIVTAAAAIARSWPKQPFAAKNMLRKLLDQNA